MNLKSKTIKGIKWTTFSTVITTVLQLLQLSILARLLEPAAFGLMSLVMIVIGFSQAFLDMGISNAIIHKQEITHNQLSTLYWLNVIAGFILFVMINLLSPLIAKFYNEPALTPLVIIVGLTFLIQPFGQQFMILWQKEMRFSEIAKIDILNKSISLIVSIVFAFQGYGVYSLAYGTLTGIVSQTLQFMYRGLKEYRPSFIFKPNEVKDFLGFGMYQMGEKTINYFSTNIDKILIGKLLGMELLGLYSLAWQLIIFPLAKINPIVNKVAFPLYAKVQKDLIQLSKYYSLSIKAISLLVIPLLVYFFYYSSEIIYTFYGDGWEMSSKIMSILAFVGLLKAIGNPGGAIILAIGHADIGFWWNLCWVILVTVVLSIVISISPNIIIVSYSLLFLCLLTTPIWHIIIHITTKIKYKLIARNFILIFLLSMLIGALSLQIINFLNLRNGLLKIAISSIIYGSIYLFYIIKSEKKLLLMFFKKGD